MTTLLNLASKCIPIAALAGLILANRVESEPKVWNPSRKQLLKEMRETKQFDVLIIGGGATGAGCALDAATRGLKTALVEQDDFSSGTSSRSTKLVHGGVRYLEKAFLELDHEQYKLVCEALNERAVFLKIAPYLSYELPIMIPLQKWWQVPYYFIGAKAYDFLAGSKNLTGSYYMNKNQALMQFPMLKSQGLVGAIVYYDGVHNDSRMNVAVAMTAIQHGACVANHVKVESLIKENDRVCGANVRDQLTGDCWPVYSKVVINATGPFCDSIRKMDDPNVKEIVSPSAGVHLILPNYFSPRNMGLIDPYTSDGRVIFFLPWQGSTIVGTTDSPTSVTANPIPQDQDINWILKQVANYLSPDLQLRRGDVLAAWSGIRPLVSDPDAKNTSQLVRNHMINISESGLLTIAGGKWTTYRKMAEDTINLAIERFDLKPLHPCNTADIKLVGSQSWTKNTFIKLIQHFGFETEVAQHLSDSYGDRSWAVAAVAKETGGEWPVYGRRVIPGYPYIEAEIRYSCHQEYACTVVDVIARRTRLSFLNARACLEALPRIIDIMAGELDWDSDRKIAEYQNGCNFLLTMGLSIKDINKPVFPRIIHGPDSVLTKEEVRVFQSMYFSPAELSMYQEVFDQHSMNGSMDQLCLEKALAALNIDMKNALVSDKTLDFASFLEILADFKDSKYHSNFGNHSRHAPLTTERSGGGV